ncbi:hypothetical protein CesoFtcFv8_008639 [Champsocephalus esox]|nr:hypothetical protein CesoFtcFv8_008639 [Champsocephalus esox]
MKRRGDETRTEAGSRRARLNSGPLLRGLASRGPESGDVLWWKVLDTPPRSRQDSVNRRRMRAKKAGVTRRRGGKRHGEVSATACSVLSAVGQLSALLSSLGFMSDTIYLAVKPPQPSHSPLPPSLLPTIQPPPRQPPSIALVATEASTSVSSDSSDYISEQSAAGFML